MVDVLRHLPPAQFKDIKFPVTSRTFRFAHENAPNKLQYANGAFVEMTGTGAPTWSYEVPLRDGVAIGPYQQMFSKVAQSLLEAFLEREPGILIDPVWGEFRVAPASWEDSLASTRGRDGVDLIIEFTDKPLLEEDFQPELASLDGLIDEAARLDEEVAAVPWEQEEPPQPTIDPLSAAAGIVRQVEFEISQYLDRLERYVDRTEAVLRATERHERPEEIYGVRRRANRAKHAAKKAEKLVTDPLKPLRAYMNDILITVPELAAQLGTDVASLVKKNPFLARNGGVVVPGTQVFYSQD